MLFRSEAQGTVARLRSAQLGVLSQLLNDERIGRLVEYEALAKPGEQVYPAWEYLGDVRRGVWSELSAESPTIDVYRRNLQRGYLDLAARLMSSPSAPPARGGASGLGGSGGGSGDARPLLRGELVALRQAVTTALPKTRDTLTRLHLQDVLAEISQILDPAKGEGKR